VLQRAAEQVTRYITSSNYLLEPDVHIVRYSEVSELPELSRFPIIVSY